MCSSPALTPTALPERPCTGAGNELTFINGAVLASWAAIRRRLPARPVLAWTAILALAAILAYDPLLGGLLRALPPLDRAINLRWIALAAFALLVLAAHGWHALATQGLGVRGQGLGVRLQGSAAANAQSPRNTQHAVGSTQ